MPNLIANLRIRRFYQGMWELIIFGLGVAASSFGFILSQQYAQMVKRIESLNAEMELLVCVADELNSAFEVMESIKGFHAEEFDFSKPSHTFPYPLEHENLSNLKRELLLRSRFSELRLGVSHAINLTSTIKLDLEVLSSLMAEWNGGARDGGLLDDILNVRKKIVVLAELFQKRIEEIHKETSDAYDLVEKERGNLLQKHPFGGLVGEEFWSK